LRISCGEIEVQENPDGQKTLNYKEDHGDGISTIRRDIREIVKHRFSPFADRGRGRFECDTVTQATAQATMNEMDGTNEFVPFPSPPWAWSLFGLAVPYFGLAAH
jgi:hypothetical protein